MENFVHQLRALVGDAPQLRMRPKVPPVYLAWCGAIKSHEGRHVMPLQYQAPPFRIFGFFGNRRKYGSNASLDGRGRCSQDLVAECRKSHVWGIQDTGADHLWTAHIVHVEGTDCSGHRTRTPVPPAPDGDITFDLTRTCRVPLAVDYPVQSVIFRVDSVDRMQAHFNSSPAATIGGAVNFIRARIAQKS